ncbi:MAG: amino acid permease [Actinomycetia bacterium]|nr:amino acid permease [Actinomycetes bacterium]MCP4083786.1 amino acid permease [Actinomycetes bacterium]
MAPPASSLERSLTLRHVFALSTGAMFSSGLFLLPGLAVAKGGPAAVLAYLIAGLLAVPAMLSVAELSTAMPRSGGAYYFVERALGPAVGTIAGMGTWLSLVLKDAFALVGMSAYLNIVFDVPSKPLAVALIVAFTLVNILGSKASASLQTVLVAFVLLVMVWFLAGGLPSVGSGDGSLDPFFETGASGVLAVVGLVFVSYGGLTNVASAAEEIEDPSRNIPLGMSLSLAVGCVVYTLAVLVTVAVVPADALHEDLAPIHTAAEATLPAAGAIFVVIAALAAFSSAANAGILAAARYPLAMSREGLVSRRFQDLSRFSTPVLGIVATGAGMAAVVLAFDAGAIAKLASAFVLLTLGLVNLAVIVLRASRIQSYAPAFRAPLFPWIQVGGILVSIYLIVGLGALPLTLVAVFIMAGLLWYRYYGRSRATRAGAIYHVFERWGRSADRGLDREISAAIQSHGLRAQDEYPGLIARAAVIYIPEGSDINEAADRASNVLSRRIGIDPAEVTDRFLDTGSLWMQPVERHPTATPVAFFDTDDDHLVIARSASGTSIPAQWGGQGERVRALFFLAGSTNQPGRALRLAGELAAYLHSDAGEALVEAVFETEVKEALLPELSIAQYPLLRELSTGGLIGRRFDDLAAPDHLHLEAVRREGRVIRVESGLILEPDDQLTVIGPLDGLPDADELARILLGTGS